MIYIKIILLIVAAQSAIFPPPLSQNLSSNSFLLLPNPCLLNLQSQVNFDATYYFNKIVKRLALEKECKSGLLSKQSTVMIKLIQNQRIKLEGYQLTIENQGITLQFSSYAGYVYGLESLYQLTTNNFKIPLGTIKDEPLLSHRGLLVDTSRHFIQVETLKRLITTMPLVKLNILHLHMNDNQAFSFGSQSHPEIPQAAAYSKDSVYNRQDLQQLINIGKLNGVSIIPEIDTPGHVKSWVKSENWKIKNITIQCDKYNHQLDITLGSSLNLTKQLIHQIDYLFKDSPYIHLGSDSINQACWDKRKDAFNTFKKLHNIKTNEQLYLLWRFEIKQALPQTRKTIFYHQNIKIKSSPTDILQYTGNQQDTAQALNETQGLVILTPRDLLTLSAGLGDIFGNNGIPNYVNWRTLYQKLQIFPKGVDKSRIWGAEVSVWSPLTNDDTLQNIVWMRGAVFAARVWSEQILPTYQIVESIVGLQNTLYRLDIQASPITSQFCQVNAMSCFPPGKTQIAIQ